MIFANFMKKVGSSQHAHYRFVNAAQRDVYAGASHPILVERDPVGPATGTDHVIRGAGWMDAVMSELRLTYRDQGSEPRPDVGFRIARYAE